MQIELTEKEIQFLQNLLAQCTVRPTENAALEICQLVQSLTVKLKGE